MTGGDLPTDIADRIVDIWRELFDDPHLDVAPADNFFTLGASSLLALRLAERLSATFGLPVDLLAVIEDPTLAGLTRHVDKALESAGSLEVGEL